MILKVIKPIMMRTVWTEPVLPESQKDKGTLDHIVLDDLYIHDVDGNVYNKHMTNGGIYFIVEKPTDENKQVSQNTMMYRLKIVS